MKKLLLASLATAVSFLSGRAVGLDEAHFARPLPYDLGLTSARPDSQVRIDRDSLGEVLAEVPCKEYCRAYVTCAADPDPKRDCAFTVRLTRHVTGLRQQWLGRSYSAMADTLVELDTATKTQVGETLLNGCQVPLWRVEVPLKTADIHDIVFTDQRGDHLDKGRYLDLELMGRCWTVPTPGRDMRINVDPHYVSAITVYKVELEDTPCEVEFKPIEPGNVFHNDESPETRVELRVKEPGSYRLAWSIRDIAGGLVAEDSVEVTETGAKTVALANDGNGWYALDWKLFDGERLLLTHKASFAMLGQDTRQAKQGEGYGIWPPFTGHYRPDPKDPAEREVGLKLVNKAGFRRLFDSVSSVPVDERNKYKVNDVVVARFPSDWLSGKRDEEKMREIIAQRMTENPSCNKAMVYHESYPHPGRQSVECVGGDTNLCKRLDDEQERLQVGMRAAKFLRDNFPDVKIMVGNSLASSAFISELIRNGYPENYADYMGLEVVGSAQMPEYQLPSSLQAAECMVETARHYGYKWGVTQCFESNFRLDKLIGPERQAAWYVRDLMIGHCWRFDDLFVAGTVAAGNHYTTTNWGDSDICNRMPWCYPKPSYVALATATKVMDCITDREILDTGDKTVYAVRLDRADGKAAYVFWTSFGTAELALKTDGGFKLVDMYGRRVLPSAGTSPDTCRISVSESATYLVADGPVVQSACVISRAFPSPEIPADWHVVAKADSADDWEIVPGELWMVGHAPGSSWPARVAGNGVLRTVSDDEKGEALEIELVNPNLDLKPIVAEYTFARLRKPVLVDSPFASLGLWLKGNSGWGEVFFVLKDANGRRTVSCETGMQGKLDHTASMVACYTGWNFCTFPVLQSSSVPEISAGIVSWNWTGGSPVKFPVTVEGIVFQARSRPLFLSETATEPYRQAIRIRDIGVFDFNRPIEAPNYVTYYDDDKVNVKTPAVGATNVDTHEVVFTWDGQKEPPFQVELREVLSNQVVYQTNVTGKTFTVHDLKPHTVYSWSARNSTRIGEGTFKTFAKDWSGTDGKVIVPSGETWTIEDWDVSAVAALDEIAFEDATASVKYVASTELALKAKLSGAGNFAAVGGNKVTFSGDSHDFEGVIAITNTVTYMASRYGLGSRKSRLFLQKDGSGTADFCVTATGADCVIDVPIVYDGRGYTFGPNNASDTLIFSNDLVSVSGGYDYRPHFKNTVRIRDGVFGTTKKDSNFFPGIDSAQVWLEDDVQVDVKGNIYFMTSSSGATHWNVKPANLSSTVQELRPQLTSGPFVLGVADALKGTSARWRPYSSSSNPSGYLDVNGHDQESGIWAGDTTPTEAKGNFYIIRSASPATISYGAESSGSETLAARFDDQAGLHVNGAKQVTLVNSASTSTGPLRVSDTARLTMNWSSKWDGSTIAVEDTATLDCQCATAVTKGRAALTVGPSATLNIASGVTLVVASATIGSTPLEQNRTYTVAQLADMGLGERVTGAGAIQVVEYVKPWEGWPTEPGQKAEVPSGTPVTVDVADHAKALACREIYMQADASVTFVNLPAGTVITNAFTGKGTVKFVSVDGLVMQSEGAGLVDPGHVELQTCDTVYVDKPTALGGEGSGACYFLSTDDKQRNLYFRGSGAITNRAAILFDGGLNFGPLEVPSTGTRLYQANSWQYNSPGSQYAYICNAVTFCGGTFGTVANYKTAFFCGKTAATDIVLDDEVDFKMGTGAAVFFYDKGTWHFGPGTATFGGIADALIRLGVASCYFNCDAPNVLGGNTPVALYTNNGSPTGYLNLNGHDQTMPYFQDQNLSVERWTENHARIDSPTPAQIILTSTAAASRTVNFKFRDYAGLWLQGNDNVTLARQQSTSLGELKISGGSVTLKNSASWAGSVVVDGGKLIVDATAGGKYTQSSAVETPVFSANSKFWITDGGQVALGTNVAVRSVVTGANARLRPGVWGSSAALAAGRIDADHVRDDLFDSTCTGTMTVGGGILRGLRVIIR